MVPRCIPFLTLFFVLAALAAPSLQADELILSNGQKLDGKIVYEDEFKVRIQLKFGEMEVERSRIVEIRRKATPAELHQQELDGCETAEDFYQLGLKARDEWDLKMVAIDDFQRAVRLNPDHEGAREALGFKQLDGAWVTAKEWYEANDYVEFEGEWLPADEAQRRRREMADELRKEAENRQARFREEQLGVPWAQAHVIETPHYIIKCNSTREVAEQYAEFMEKLYEKYDRIFSAFPKQYHQKSTINIFRNHQEFMDLMLVPPGIGGFYRPGSYGGLPPRVVTAYHGAFGDTGNTFAVLAHEGTHQFEHLVLKGEQSGEKAVRDFMVRPDWVIEGLAVYFGDGHYVGRKGNIQIGLPRDRVENLQRAIETKKIIKLSQLIRIPHEHFGGEFYAPAWGFIYYLVKKGSATVGGKTVDMAKVFKDYFQFLSEPPAPEADHPEYYARKFEEMLGVPLDDLQEDWEQFILDLKLEPVGRLTGGSSHFASPSLEFEVDRPGRRWDFVLEADGLRFRLEKAGLQHSRSSARIGIVATNEIRSFPTEQLIPIVINGGFGATFKGMNIEEQEAYLHHQGFEGLRVTFTATEAASEKTVFDPRSTKQKFRLYFIRTVWRDYLLLCQADEGEFAEYEEDFEKVLKSFRILSE